MRKKWITISSLLLLGIIARADQTGTYKGKANLKEADMKAFILQVMKSMPKGQQLTAAQVDAEAKKAVTQAQGSAVTLVLSKGGKATIAAFQGTKKIREDAVEWAGSGSTMSIKSKGKVVMAGTFTADGKTLTLVPAGDAAKGPKVTYTLKKS